MSLKIVSTGQKVFRFFNGLFLLLIAVTMLIPMLAVIKDSLDYGGQPEVRISLIPQEFTLIFAPITVYTDL